jgi:hypothetical protein
MTNERDLDHLTHILSASLRAIICKVRAKVNLVQLSIRTFLKTMINIIIIKLNQIF